MAMTEPADDSRAGWWLSRPCLLEAFALANIAFLGGDVAFAHMANDFHHRGEWIPPIFSAVAALLLLVSFPTSHDALQHGGRRRIGLLVGALSCAVGIAGLFWHLNSQFFELRTLASLVYTAPFAAPLAYTGVGLLILMNRMVSARTMEWAQWVLMLCAMGLAGNFVLTLCDHAINGFFHPAEWLAVAISAFAMAFTLIAILAQPTREYLAALALVLAVNAVVGVWGAGLHGMAILDGPSESLVENALFGAPPGAPLLLTNLSALGFLGWWDLRVKVREGQTYA